MAGLRAFFVGLHERASAVFRMETVQVSKKAVDMLALTISCIDGKLIATPRLKDKGPPLSTESAHPRHVLASWPGSVCRGLGKLCTRAADARHFQQQFIDNFARYHAPQWLLRKLRYCLLPRAFTQPTPQRGPSMNEWLVLSYHPCWKFYSISSAIRAFLRDSLRRGVLNDALARSVQLDVRAARRDSLEAAAHLVR